MSKERKRGCVNRERERLREKRVCEWGERVGEKGNVRVWMSELQLGREAGE